MKSGRISDGLSVSFAEIDGVAGGVLALPQRWQFDVGSAGFVDLAPVAEAFASRFDIVSIGHNARYAFEQ